MPTKQSPLFDLIRDRIQTQGPMPVSEYMNLALGHPAHGYYMTRDPFGVAGDFITSPEISQMFGEMIGAWLVDLWMQFGHPESVQLVELGPGRGTLSADIMRTISTWPEFHAAVTLHLVETSPKLREVQAETLKDCQPVWHDRLDKVPEGFSFIVANEFFDALPLRQFVKTEGVWRERCVGYDAGKGAFFFTAGKPENFVFPAGRDGDVFETSPVSIAIARAAAERVARHGGAMLIADYGHEQAGVGDTLQAVSKHAYADPLQGPGEKDITAHVDFSAVSKVAEPFVKVAGPVTQGKFLIDLGIEARAEKLCANASHEQCESIMGALCRLVAPQEMGRLFKVMAFTPKEAKIIPAGFGVHRDEDTDD